MVSMFNSGFDPVSAPPLCVARPLDARSVTVACLSALFVRRLTVVPLAFLTIAISFKKPPQERRSHLAIPCTWCRAKRGRRLQGTGRPSLRGDGRPLILAPRILELADGAQGGQRPAGL